MQNSKHLVVIAGEESGDKHAANFIRELQSRHPNLTFSGIGGQHMQDAGVHLVSDLARYAVTGTVEIIRHLKTIRRGFHAIKAHLKETRPDALILVDYPGFNLRLIKYAKQELGLKIIYYISPQIWAWKASRIHKIRAYVDKMAVILPFEKKIYEEGGVPVAFVGHPLVEQIDLCENIHQARTDFQLPLNKRIIALLPGSRRNEIEYHMPILRDSAQKLSEEHADLHFVIPAAENIALSTLDAYFKGTSISYTLHKGHATKIVACSDCVVVASGTASLECALLEKPMCIIYKASMLSYVLAFIFIKVRYLGLCNLLQNEMIAPELLQYDCNPVELTKIVKDLLNDPNVSKRMVKRLQQMKFSLSGKSSDCSIATLIENEIYQEN